MATPPREIWQPIESIAPGIYNYFFRAVEAGLSESRSVALSSWWRSRSENSRVGGDASSQHLVGFAADLVVDDPAAVVDRMISVGLTAVDEGDHVHVQLLPAGVVIPLLLWLGV